MGSEKTELKAAIDKARGDSSGGIKASIEFLNARANQIKDWDAVYLEFDPFSEDRDVTIECRKVSLVRLRKPQTCVAGGLLDGVHTIEPGMVAKKESAKVDGEFGTCYHCIPCLDRLMAVNKKKAGG
jgi:hypothetical protein